jgi:hypothetical protein
MALTDENGMNTTMLVSPTGGNMGGFGNAFGGDGSFWILLLFILLGNGGMWGGFGAGNYGMIGSEMYPWMNQANLTSSGFQNQMLNDNVTSIRDGISGLSTQLCGCCGDIQNSLCNGFAGVNATVNNGFSQAEIAANSRQMANMQQAFNAQTAVTAGMNSLAQGLQNCCCENRAGIADLKYTVATENCADRAALSDGIRDVIANQTANTQRILDQLCNDKIDAKNDEISALRQQLAMKDLAASQTAQNAFIANEINQQNETFYNRLSTCPIPSTPVYGRQNIFTCPQNAGCGCGGFAN